MKNGIRIPPESYDTIYFVPEICTVDGTFKSPNHRTDGPALTRTYELVY